MKILIEVFSKSTNVNEGFLQLWRSEYTNKIHTAPGCNNTRQSNYQVQGGREGSIGIRGGRGHPRPWLRK